MNRIVFPQAEQRRLTPRQRECLRHVYERRTTKEIAALTGLAVGTVDTYVAEAVTALGARNRRHAAELAHEGHPQYATPEKLEPEETGVPDLASEPLSPEPRKVPRHEVALLPFRSRGAIGNDLNPVVRAVAIVGFAIALAAGFGMLAVGMRVISDFTAAVG